MTTARIAPGTRREIGLPAWVFSRGAGLVMRTQPPAIFTTLSRNRGLFWGWMHFAGRLMPFGRLSRKESELVILAVSGLADCAYERAHHTALGRRAGVTAADIAALDAGEERAEWTERERLLVAATRELHETKDLSDASWAQLAAVFDERELLEILLLTQHYEMLATVLGVLRLAPDAQRPKRVLRSFRA
jgi:AhpD family alkylhydroperoxidase